MTTVLIYVGITVYVLTAVVVGRAWTGHTAYRRAKSGWPPANTPTSDDWGLAAIEGSFVGVAWPAVLIGRFIPTIARSLWRYVGRPATKAVSCLYIGEELRHRRANGMNEGLLGLKNRLGSR